MKKQYFLQKDIVKSKKIYFVGHSGGVATSSIITGYNPNLIDGIVLVAFPANIKIDDGIHGQIVYPLKILSVVLNSLYKFILSVEKMIL